MDEAPVGAHQRAALGFAQRRQRSRRAVAQAIDDLAGIGFERAGDQIEQRRLARARFADDRQRLALFKLERNVAAGDDRAVAFVEAAD